MLTIQLEVAPLRFPLSRDDEVHKTLMAALKTNPPFVVLIPYQPSPVSIFLSPYDVDC